MARRALGNPRIGHGGTLDPFATGLLVLLVGKATRLLPYIDGEPKVYEAVIRFGLETTTDDRTGAPVREAPWPGPQAVDAAVAHLTGELLQVPPAYSAKQIAGKRAYRAARAGTPIDLEPAHVRVYSWAIAHQEHGVMRATITCSGGTYVRALARDLGRRSGSAAHLAELRRLGSGCFDVVNAVDIATLAANPVTILPPERAVPSMARRTLSDDECGRIGHGNRIVAAGEGARVALFDSAGALVAIAERSGPDLLPRVVLSRE